MPDEIHKKLLPEGVTGSYVPGSMGIPPKGGLKPVAKRSAFPSTEGKLHECPEIPECESCYRGGAEEELERNTAIIDSWIETYRLDRVYGNVCADALLTVREAINA